MCAVCECKLLVMCLRKRKTETRGQEDEGEWGGGQHSLSCRHQAVAYNDQADRGCVMQGAADACYVAQLTPLSPPPPRIVILPPPHPSPCLILYYHRPSPSATLPTKTAQVQANTAFPRCYALPCRFIKHSRCSPCHSPPSPAAVPVVRWWRRCGLPVALPPVHAAVAVARSVAGGVAGDLVRGQGRRLDEQVGAGARRRVLGGVLGGVARADAEAEAGLGAPGSLGVPVLERQAHQHPGARGPVPVTRHSRCLLNFSWRCRAADAAGLRRSRLAQQERRQHRVLRRDITTHKV